MIKGTAVDWQRAGSGPASELGTAGTDIVPFAWSNTCSIADSISGSRSGAHPPARAGSRRARTRSAIGPSRRNSLLRLALLFASNLGGCGDIHRRVGCYEIEFIGEIDYFLL